ncbi:unnamed protein product [marine sediment metagenome]|uniref:DNA methylase N-4/N-6 domain-containing protein n=1 Tax=marine sediment metagenome TaxID=412755 RepID=X1AME2_9ZZZZ
MSTQKPEALLERIISVSSEPGDVILDPVGGTGTTGYVARKLGRHFIMVEKVAKYVDAAERRLEALQLGMGEPERNRKEQVEPSGVF